MNGRVSFAIILTCFNRVEETLKCLNLIQESVKFSSEESSIRYDVYLTDDGSSDNTALLVQQEFPKAIISQGNGNLYWSEGMILSWELALEKGGYDFFLLVNNDTFLLKNGINELLTAFYESNKEAIIVGNIRDPKTRCVSYGGRILTNKFFYKSILLKPNGRYQSCDLGNANIMLVPPSIIDSIGIFSKGFRHGKADFDFTLRARKSNFQVWLTKGFIAECTFDHDEKYSQLVKFSGLMDRVRFLYSPKGFDMSSNLKFMKRHFPLRLPFIHIMNLVRLFFPKLFIRIKE